MFGRYVARHLRLSDHRPVGAAVRVARVTLRDGRLIVSGSVVDPAVTGLALHLGGLARSISPDATGSPAFQLDLPWQVGPITLEITASGGKQTLILPGFAARRLALARAALLPGFALAGLRALPAGLHWLRHHDPQSRARVKHLFGLDLADTPQRLDPDWFATPEKQSLTRPDHVTIVLPVFNAFDLLPEVLDRIRRHTDMPWHLIVVEDLSTDPQVRPFLRDWVASPPAGGRVTLLENAENLGFIGSVNRAFAVALDSTSDGPVVLLNADAFVPAGWAGRLLAPLQDDQAVASVTPMSNDAELMTVPVICAALPLHPGEADAIDHAARNLTLPALPVAPTGVGFCMAISRTFLRQLPTFDTGFGRGYGEEVDWCRKAAARGGRHLCLPELFVEHRGAASFGSAEKQALLRQNGAIITARYPDFDTQVQGFLRHDPLATPRLALALSWADARGETAGQGRVPVYLAHALGGGADHYLQTRIAADTGQGRAAVVLRVGAEFRWRIEVHSPAGITRGGTDDTGLMLRLLMRLRRRDVIYSCGVGDTDPAELPDILLQLGQGGDHRIGVLFHDYLPVSPSYTLLDAAGRWRGLPDPANADPAHRIRRPDGTWMALAGWQAAWGRLLALADRVTVFSDDSRALVTAAYPQVADRIVVQPHSVAQIGHQTLTRPKAAQKPVIGVLGNIGAHKGAAVIVGLSRLLARDPRAGLVVIGNLDPGFALAGAARVHGSYDLADLAALVARYGITCWLIPSIWPETFSYVTHEALATGLPVWSFDLGAQGAAIRAAVAQGAAGGVIALRDGQGDPADILAAILGRG